MSSGVDAPSPAWLPEGPASRTDPYRARPGSAGQPQGIRRVCHRVSRLPLSMEKAAAEIRSHHHLARFRRGHHAAVLCDVSAPAPAASRRNRLLRDAEVSERDAVAEGPSDRGTPKTAEDRGRPAGHVAVERARIEDLERPAIVLVARASGATSQRQVESGRKGVHLRPRAALSISASWGDTPNTTDAFFKARNQRLRRRCPAILAIRPGHARSLATESRSPRPTASDRVAAASARCRCFDMGRTSSRLRPPHARRRSRWPSASLAASSRPASRSVPVPS